MIRSSLWPASTQHRRFGVNDCIRPRRLVAPCLEEVWLIVQDVKNLENWLQQPFRDLQSFNAYLIYTASIFALSCTHAKFFLRHGCFSDVSPPSFMLGIVTVQTYTYFSTFRNDLRILKWFNSLVWYPGAQFPNSLQCCAKTFEC